MWAAISIAFTAGELVALFVGLTLSYAACSHLLEQRRARKDNR